MGVFLLVLCPGLWAAQSGDTILSLLTSSREADIVKGLQRLTQQYGSGKTLLPRDTGPLVTAIATAIGNPLEGTLPILTQDHQQTLAVQALGVLGPTGWAELDRIASGAYGASPLQAAAIKSLGASKAPVAMLMPYLEHADSALVSATATALAQHAQPDGIPDEAIVTAITKLSAQTPKDARTQESITHVVGNLLAIRGSIYRDAWPTVVARIPDQPWLSASFFIPHFTLAAQPNRWPNQRNTIAPCVEALDRLYDPARPVGRFERELIRVILWGGQRDVLVPHAERLIQRLAAGDAAVQDWHLLRDLLHRLRLEPTWALPLPVDPATRILRGEWPAGIAHEDQATVRGIATETMAMAKERGGLAPPPPPPPWRSAQGLSMAEVLDQARQQMVGANAVERITAYHQALRSVNVSASPVAKEWTAYVRALASLRTTVTNSARIADDGERQQAITKGLDQVTTAYAALRKAAQSGDGALAEAPPDFGVLLTP